MKPIKKIQLTILATVLAISTSCQYLMSMEIAASPAVEAPKESQFNASKKTALTDAQKTEQASLPFAKRMASQIGSALGFQSRGNFLNQKGIDFAKTEREVSNAPETNSGLNMTDLQDKTKTGNKVGTQDRTMQDYMSNSLRNLVSSDRKITKVDAEGNKVVETWSKDEKLQGVKILAKDGSYRIVDPTGKVTSELTPDGRQIKNEYGADGKLTQSTEITPNRLNFGNNRTVKVTKFDENGNPKRATIQIGSSITGKTILEQEFKENSPQEYTLTDITDNENRKVLETRTATKNTYGTTTLTTRNNKDAINQDGKFTGQKQITQETILDKEGKIKSLEIFNKSKESKVDASSTKVSVDEKGQVTILVTDAQHGPISKITQGQNGLQTVETVRSTLLGSLSSTAKRRIVEVNNGNKGTVTTSTGDRNTLQTQLTAQKPAVVQGTVIAVGGQGLGEAQPATPIAAANAKSGTWSQSGFTAEPAT